MTTETTPTSLRWRIAFAGTLAAAMGIGPFAVTAISALSPFVVEELGLSRAQLGSLATVTFFVAAIGSVFGGRFVDALGGRHAMVWIFLIGGVAVLPMAGAQGLAWLWAGAVLGGASQMFANPATNQLIADHVPMGRRGVQIGVKQSGVQMTQALIGFGLPPLALLVGWRGSTLLGALLATLGMLAVLAVIPGGGAADHSGPSTGRVPLDPGVWWLAVYAFTIGMTIQSVLIYGPLYAYEAVGVPAAVAGMATGVLGISGVAGRIVWTQVAERRDAPTGMMAFLAAGAFLAVVGVLAAGAVGPWLFYPALVAFGGSAVAVNAVVQLAAIRAAGTGRTGRASGVAAFGQFLGFMSGPLLFGVLVDATDSYAVGWTVVCGLCLAALAITFFWRRHARLRGGSTPGS